MADLALEKERSANEAGLWRLLARLVAHGDPVVALAIIWVFMLLVQNATPGIIGNDGYFHIKFARLMWQQGLRVDFPYLPLTILNEQRFTDHHFLYHLALMPFALGDLRSGAKIAGLVYGIAGVFSVYWVMSRIGIKYPLFWLFALLGSGEWFLVRESMTRRESLSLMTLVLATWLLLSKRYRWLAPLAFLYAWLFDGFVLLVAVATVALIAHLIAERRLEWRLLAWTVLGLAASQILNPYFPNNLQFTLLHVLPKLQPETEVSIGNEWLPFPVDLLLQTSWLSLVMVPLGLLPASLRMGRAWRDPRFLLLAGLAVMFLGLYLRYRRFIEYSPAFAVLLCSYAWTYLAAPAAGEGAPAVNSSEGAEAGALPRNASGAVARRLTIVAMTVVALIVGGQAYRALDRATRLMASPSQVPPYDRYADVAEYIAAHSPPLSPMFHTEWSEFPELFFFNTHNTYMVGLDPSYMVLENRDRYVLWRNITRGLVERPSSQIRDVFGAEWVMTNKLESHVRFIAIADRDPGLERAFETPYAIVYHVKGG